LGQEEFNLIERKLFELVAEVMLDPDGIRVFEEVRDRDPGIKEFRLEQSEEQRVARVDRVHHLVAGRG